MGHLVTGTFFDFDRANAAVERLQELGYRRDEISLVMSNDTRRRFGADDATAADRGTKTAVGAASGGLIGGTIGAIVAAFALTGAIGATAATGGIAAPFVAGPLAAALAGAGAGAASGGILGALFGAALPADDLHRMEHDVEAGGIIVAVDARDGDEAQVREILRGDRELLGSGTDTLETSARTSTATLEPDESFGGTASLGEPGLGDVGRSGH